MRQLEKSGKNCFSSWFSVVNVSLGLKVDLFKKNFIATLSSNILL